MTPHSAVLLQVLFGLVAVCLVLDGVNASPLGDPLKGTPESCSAQQTVETPCRCCKMDCWYTIASSATHELGHVPGQAGEEEALATLRLIRTCMIEQCTSVCARRRPFFAPQ
ncbi:hypothetical protein QR680_005373 [Steinernema hermaphroditum]|uniref:Uncharacterized protein n=1 Tax=Steinernema hermaphroditum TaxID=289476 RepID=A0AA39HT63_9BILA|nr:hypothetical protein QR680_005373 [Steinernema hermaphroditum]